MREQRRARQDEMSEDEQALYSNLGISGDAARQESQDV